MTTVKYAKKGSKYSTGQTVSFEKFGDYDLVALLQRHLTWKEMNNHSFENLQHICVKKSCYPDGAF